MITPLSDQALNFIASYKDQAVEPLLFKPQICQQESNTTLVTQIKGRFWARHKAPFLLEFPQFRFPQKLALEQASSEVTALYKANRIADFLTTSSTGVDLTAGMGIDAALLSERFSQYTVYEKDKLLAELLAFNMQVIQPKISVINRAAETALTELEPADFIYLDPARRDARGNKTVRWEDCSPNLLELLPELLQKAKLIGVKASPMIDITHSLKLLSPYVLEVDLLTNKNELKEVVFWLSPIGGQSEYINVPLNHIHLESESNKPLCCTLEQLSQATLEVTDHIEQYLYDPNPSLLKTKGFRRLDSLFPSLKGLSTSSLLTAPDFLNHFPGRVFKCIEVVQFSKNTLKPFKKQAFSVISKYPKIEASTFKKEYQLRESEENFLIIVNTGKTQVIHCKKLDPRSL